MIVNCGPNPNVCVAPMRFPLDRWTFIQVQVRSAANIFLGTDQNEVQTPGDGILYTQTSTATPVTFRIRGNLWYSSNVANAQFVVINLGTGPKDPKCQ